MNKDVMQAVKQTQSNAYFVFILESEVLFEVFIVGPLVSGVRPKLLAVGVMVLIVIGGIRIKIPVHARADTFPRRCHNALDLET